jgi:hypothetical protein
MTLPPNYQDVLNSARNTYFKALPLPFSDPIWKEYENILNQFAELMDIDQKQAHDLVVTRNA